MATRKWFVAATAVAWFGGLLGFGALTGCGPRLSLYQKGVEALRQKQYAEAIEWFSEELDDNPESHLALGNRGEAYFETRRLEQAIEDYSRAITLLERQQRPNPWFYNRRGLAYYDLARYAEAVADWNRAKELETERARAGIKVRRAPTYLSMSALRDTLLFDAERQVARAPERAVATPHTPAPTRPGAPEAEPEVEAQASTPPTQPASSLQSEPATQPEAPTQPETGVASTGEPSSEAAAAHPSGGSSPTPLVTRLSPEHTLAIEQARMAHEAAVLEREARETEAAQAAAAQEQAIKEARRAAQREQERLAALERQRERERLERERREQEASAIAAARAEHEARAQSLAEQAARIEPVADLSGTWIRDDDYVFSLLDDGRRVIGTITDTEDFVFYEITLEWTDNETLTGFAVLKENLSPCRFETSTAWSLKVQDDGTLLAEIEEVGWDANCEENERTWGSYTFRRAK